MPRVDWAARVAQGEIGGHLSPLAAARLSPRSVSDKSRWAAVCATPQSAWYFVKLNTLAGPVRAPRFGALPVG
jgi:hypothetical protein